MGEALAKLLNIGPVSGRQVAAKNAAIDVAYANAALPDCLYGGEEYTKVVAHQSLRCSVIGRMGAISFYVCLNGRIMKARFVLIPSRQSFL